MGVGLPARGAKQRIRLSVSYQKGTGGATLHISGFIPNLCEISKGPVVLTELLQDLLEELLHEIELLSSLRHPNLVLLLACT